MWEHEELVVRRGARSGITTMVAVHSRVLGPAIGGCRMKRYPQVGAAIDDVLLLAKAMSHKCAVAGVPYGGGKSVIALDDRPLTPELRRAVLLDHADLIASFGGSYLAGPDIGTGSEDMLVFREQGPYAFCVPESHGGVGSSSVPTAAGVLAALRAGARQVFGSENLAGRRVVISGYGAVGARVARGIDGAEIIVSDVDETKRAAAGQAGLGWVEPAKALQVKADVLIPAAVGGVLSRETAGEIDVALIVGPANNQLTDDSVADLLDERGIVWVPDFVASAGGIIYTLAREVDGLDHAAASARVETIESTVAEILPGPGTPLARALALANHRLRR
ncbi:Glu/Leu/Phe/Val dehydrogenase dimerization domain-containing protein [Amycolatopsis sp. cg5]|uniref:Glu/Leu/Phe/Val dehydrogenase dimerization domain-containing protein n=1 Tax=Amycolatopsis sp. cg5 TaxID=3238802 RepID=UPI003523EB9A